MPWQLVYNLQIILNAGFGCMLISPKRGLKMQNKNVNTQLKYAISMCSTHMHIIMCVCSTVYTVSCAATICVN